MSSKTRIKVARNDPHAHERQDYNIKLPESEISSKYSKDNKLTTKKSKLGRRVMNDEQYALEKIDFKNYNGENIQKMRYDMVNLRVQPTDDIGLTDRLNQESPGNLNAESFESLLDSLKND